jgi:hypothetical protein
MTKRNPKYIRPNTPPANESSIRVWRNPVPQRKTSCVTNRLIPPARNAQPRIKDTLSVIHALERLRVPKYPVKTKRNICVMSVTHADPIKEK